MLATIHKQDTTFNLRRLQRSSQLSAVAITHMRYHIALLDRFALAARLVQLKPEPRSYVCLSSTMNRASTAARTTAPSTVGAPAIGAAWATCSCTSGPGGASEAKPTLAFGAAPAVVVALPRVLAQEATATRVPACGSMLESHIASAIGRLGGTAPSLAALLWLAGRGTAATTVGAAVAALAAALAVGVGTAAGGAGGSCG